MTCPPPPKSGVPVDLSHRTSDYYRCCKLPKRFDCPQLLSNYGCQKKPPSHPFYQTTSSEYGFYPPSFHTVPTMYRPRNQDFTSANSKAGMYRNYSLNM